MADLEKQYIAIEGIFQKYPSWKIQVRVEALPTVIHKPIMDWCDAQLLSKMKEAEGKQCSLADLDAFSFVHILKCLRQAKALQWKDGRIEKHLATLHPVEAKLQDNDIMLQVVAACTECAQMPMETITIQQAVECANKLNGAIPRRPAVVKISSAVKVGKVLPLFSKLSSRCLQL